MKAFTSARNVIVIRIKPLARYNNIGANLMVRFVINISELITSLWSRWSLAGGYYKIQT